MCSWQEQHNGTLPEAAADVQQFVAGVAAEHAELAASVGRCSSAEISPMCSVIGGITAQEVLKVLPAAAGDLVEHSELSVVEGLHWQVHASRLLVLLRCARVLAR